MEKLRVQVAECEMIRDLATDKAKRGLFDRLAKHYQVLAGQADAEIARAIPTPDVLDRVALLQNRAEEYRTIATAINDPGLREEYLRLSSDALARNEEVVAKSRKLLKNSRPDTFLGRKE